MKIKSTSVVVESGVARVYSPEYIYLYSSQQADGVWIDGKQADAVETKTIKQVEQLTIEDYGTVRAVANSIWKKAPQIKWGKISLPKLTKAAAIAIESMPLWIGCDENNKYTLLGINLDLHVVDIIYEYGSYARIISVSSGILQPILDGTEYEIGSVKNLLVLRDSNNELFICNTIKVMM